MIQTYQNYLDQYDVIGLGGRVDYSCYDRVVIIDRISIGNRRPTYRLTPENQRPTYRLTVEAK